MTANSDNRRGQLQMRIQINVATVGCMALLACAEEEPFGCFSEEPSSFPTGSGPLEAKYTAARTSAPFAGNRFAVIGHTGNTLSVEGCDDSWGGVSWLILHLHVPIRGDLPSALSDDRDTALPWAEASIRQCEDADCPSLHLTKFGYPDETTYSGQLLSFDSERGHAELDFALLIDQGQGIELAIEGELNWESDYEAIDLGDLSGAWLIEQTSDVPPAPEPLGFALTQEGGRLSGQVCDAALLNCEALNLHGYVSDALIKLKWDASDGHTTYVLDIEAEADRALHGRVTTTTDTGVWEASMRRADEG